MTVAEMERYRAETPGTKRAIHFNNAGAALPPNPVIEAMQQYLSTEARQGGYETAAAQCGELQRFYPLLGQLLNTTAQNIAWANSATTAYNTALSAIPFEAGDHIVTTEEDYVSNQLAFLQIRQRYGVQLHRSASLPNGHYDLDSLAELIRTHRPKLVAVTHVPTSSGLVQDVVLPGRLCREHGCLYLVDACQSVGQMPVDVQRIQCDFLTATFRKFLRGPRGAGFLYVSDRVLAKGYAPQFLDLHSAQWTAVDDFVPQPDGRRFETWERSYALVAGATAAVDYALEVGLVAIQARVERLSRLLREGLAELPGLHLVPGQRCGIVNTWVQGQEAMALKNRLQAHRIHASVTTSDSARIAYARLPTDACLRLSPHYYNTVEEVQEVLETLKKIMI